MKISVIVPVYNVEAYLPECIRSVLEQSMSDFEMILVDDGSTDGCPAICDAAAEQDDRVRVIHQKNGGLSRARNAGLDAARGEWIGFVDSDDCIHPDMYEKLLAAAEKNDADMAICNILRVDVQRVPLEEQGQQVPDGVFSREEILSRFREIPFHLAYNRVYRKHIFQNLRFPEGKLNEDVYIVTAVLDQVNRVACLSDHLYEYRIGRPGSIMSKKKTLRNYDAVDAVYACFRYFDRRGGSIEMLQSSEDAASVLRLVQRGPAKRTDTENKRAVFDGIEPDESAALSYSKNRGTVVDVPVDAGIVPQNMEREVTGGSTKNGST